MNKTILIAGASLVMASERELAAAKDNTEDELVYFDMEHSNDAGYKFHYANYGDDWGTVYGLPNEDNICGGYVQSPINLM